MRRRRIYSAGTLAVCAMVSVGFSPPLLAGPYSTGTQNTNAGAIDPGIAGVLSNGTVNPAFVGWATGSSSYLPAYNVDPGWNDPNAALGPVTGLYYDIVSLGDYDPNQVPPGTQFQPGQITLSFNSGIRNGPGADFAVFENALATGVSSVFGELAYVEVSSDGTHFARFPGISLTPGLVGPFGSIDPTNVYNLAGKHVNSNGQSWGTPFNLSDLSNDPLVTSGQVDLNGIQDVRIVDIPGNGSFLDSAGHPIYDPWITTGSGGFDLEAIGVTNGWLAGDANLDGVVNLADLKILAANWGKPGMDFEQGNFDLRGTVDVGDLSLLAHNWQGGGGPSLSAALSSLGLPQPTVPEPATAGIVALAVTFLSARSRRVSRHLDQSL